VSVLREEGSDECLAASRKAEGVYGGSGGYRIQGND